MRWTLTIFLCIAFGAVAYGDTPVPTTVPNAQPALQAIPQQPQAYLPVAPTIFAPQTIQVQTLQPQFSLRWGLFRRRLVPQYRYVLGPTLTYGLMVQPPQPSFRQAQ